MQEGAAMKVLASSLFCGLVLAALLMPFKGWWGGCVVAAFVLGVYHGSLTARASRHA
jgi:hypothetical protein